MPRLLYASLAGAFLALLTARYAESTLWIDALFALGAFLGVAAAMALGIGLRRLAPEGWLPVAALLLGLVAAAGRVALVALLAGANSGGGEVIRPARLLLGCGALAWAVVGLFWGISALTFSLEGGPRAPLGPSPSARALAGLVGAAAVSTCLFVLSPLASTVGLRADLWTLAGLAGLALAAYGLVEIWRRWFG